jgi:acyl dehydratase
MQLQVGDSMPEFVRGPVTRVTLALFAGASGDHAPMHLDSAAARKAGMPDVFAHGMLCMSWLGQALRQWVTADRLREWGVRFVAVTPVDATVRCFGEVIEVFEKAGDRYARLSIGARTGADVQVLAGEAIVALD